MPLTLRSTPCKHSNHECSMTRTEKRDAVDPLAPLAIFKSLQHCSQPGSQGVAPDRAHAAPTHWQHHANAVLSQRGHNHACRIAGGIQHILPGRTEGSVSQPPMVAFAHGVCTLFESPNASSRCGSTFTTYGSNLEPSSAHRRSYVNIAPTR